MNKLCECVLYKSDTSLCLHHIDKNKKNSNINNLIYVCRSCHQRIHNNYDKMTIKLKKEIAMAYLDNKTVTIDAIE